MLKLAGWIKSVNGDINVKIDINNIEVSLFSANGSVNNRILTRPSINTANINHLSLGSDSGNIIARE